MRVHTEARPGSDPSKPAPSEPAPPDGASEVGTSAVGNGGDGARVRAAAAVPARARMLRPDGVPAAAPVSYAADDWRGRIKGAPARADAHVYGAPGGPTSAGPGADSASRFGSGRSSRRRNDAGRCQQQTRDGRAGRPRQGDARAPRPPAQPNPSPCSTAPLGSGCSARCSRYSCCCSSSDRGSASGGAGSDAWPGCPGREAPCHDAIMSGRGRPRLCAVPPRQ